jgi:two-component system, NarL family, nitrate/nitrite response regulator NarL
MDAVRSDVSRSLKPLEQSSALPSRVPSPAKNPRRGPSGQPPLNLLVTDESQMGCQLLRGALERSRANFHVPACAVTRSEILQCLAVHAVDIALISDDLRGEPHIGFSVVDELRVAYPKARVILLLHCARTDRVVEAFRAGARGVFCRDEPFESLCRCIQAVGDGQIWATSAQLLSVLEALAYAKPLRVVDSRGARLLTNREDEVVHLVAEGLTNREISRSLAVTEHTVGNYLFRIYEKLGISSRVELVLYALKQKHQT